MEFVHGIKRCAEAAWRHRQLDNMRIVTFVLRDRSFAFTSGQGFAFFVSSAGEIGD